MIINVAVAGSSKAERCLSRPEAILIAQPDRNHPQAVAHTLDSRAGTEAADISITKYPYVEYRVYI